VVGERWIAEGKLVVLDESVVLVDDEPHPADEPAPCAAGERSGISSSSRRIGQSDPATAACAPPTSRRSRRSPGA
jgi:hypothetical protein